MARSRSARKKFEVEKVTTQAIRHARDTRYQQFKGEYLRAHAKMLVGFLEKGEVLCEMRGADTRYLSRLSSETGEGLDYLNSLADAYEVFQNELPRQDLAQVYYLRAAEAVKSIGDVWDSKDPDVKERAKKVARQLIKQIKPEESSPRTIATSLANFFGLIAPGNEPFIGFHSTLGRLKENEVEELVDRFDPSVQPFFREWVEEQKRLTRKGALPTGETPSPILTLIGRPLLTITLRLTTLPSDLDDLADKVNEALKAAGIQGDVSRTRLYAPGHQTSPPVDLKQLAAGE